MPPGENTTKTQNKPYKELRPLINTSIKDAMRAYKGGVGANTTSMVTPWSNQTVQAQNGIMDIAGKNADGKNGLNSNLQDIINNGGFSDRQNSAMNNMGNQLKQLGANGLSGAQDNAMSNYKQLANGTYDSNANPGYQAVRQNVINDTQNAVNLNAASAGRYGSGIHEGVQSREIGKVASTMDMNDFNNWLGRRDSANAGMASLGQQGIQNRQGLSSSLFNAAQAGQGNMTSAYQGMKSPYSDMMGVGAMNEDLMRRTLDDQQRVANVPWTQLQKLQAIGSGSGNYGTTTSTAPGPNPFLQTLGGVSVGAGLLGSLGLI